MSNNGQRHETQETRTVDSDIYEPEPSASISAVETQQPNPQPSFPDVNPTVFIGQTARRLRLETLVSEFRDGKKSRGDTLTAIHGVLDRGPLLSEEEKEASLRLCTEEIDSAEERARRGLTSIEATEPITPTRGTDPTEPRNPSGTIHTPKQTRHYSQVFGQSDNGSDLESDSGEPKKRLRLAESDMPWFGRDDLDEPSVNPSCIKTIKSLRLFNRDIKSCKFHVSVASGSPDNIPPAQWEHIFKGEPIDLDQILSSLHRITTTEERKASIGNADILLGPVEASRKVASSSDWSTAWRRAARATSFVFPHRTCELEDYAEYIENEFAAKVSTSHHRIILYDVAVRNLVRGGQQTLLTDTFRFSSLYSAIVMPDGIQYTNGGRKAQPARGKPATCNRFNDKGCNSTSCKFRHACGACGSTNHGKAACGATAKN